MKSLRTVKSIICFLMTALFVMCSSTNYFKSMETPGKLFYVGNFKEAAQRLRPLASKSGKDQNLYMMEYGYMLYADRDHSNSNTIFRRLGDRLRVRNVSIKEQVAALLVNQTSKAYQGEDFEKVLIHMYAGINFLLLRNFDGARVEFRTVNNKLAQVKSERGTPKYSEIIAAKYLCAVAYEIISRMNRDDKHDLEYAYIEYKQINQLMPNFNLVKADLQRVAKKLGYNDDYDDWVNKFGSQNIGDDNLGELVFIFEGGQGAVKKSRGKLLVDPFFRVAIYDSLSRATLKGGITVASVITAMEIAENPFPVFEKRSDTTQAVRITTSEGTSNTVALDNISDIAIKTLEDQYTSLRVQFVASLVAKAVATMAAQKASTAIAEKAGAGDFSSLIGFAVGAGTGAALFASIKPDLRCWHTLPARLNITRMFLPPGDHDIRIDYLAANGRVQRSETQKVTIKPREIAFVNRRTLE